MASPAASLKQTIARKETASCPAGKGCVDERGNVEMRGVGERTAVIFALAAFVADVKIQNSPLHRLKYPLCRQPTCQPVRRFYICREQNGEVAV